MQRIQRVGLVSGLALAGLLSVALRPGHSSPGLAGGKFQDNAQPIRIDAPAPELVGGPWLNTPQNAPLKLASRRGKVTIVEFWTFG